MVAEQLVRPFDFGAAVRAQHAQGTGLFIECGGHRALTSAVRRTLGAADSPASD
jgi:acyl transferase domain-containing protein